MWSWEHNRKFIVMSGKGGVGKTSVSVNLATALARNGFKVGLMDIDIHGPDIPRMLGLSGMLQMNEKKKINPINYSENLTVVSIESLMSDKDNAIIWRGPIKHNIIRQFISDVEWGNLDFLIIDAPPGTGDEPLTVAQLIRDVRAVIVTTPQEIALADVRKSIQFCRQVNMEIFGLIENMSGYTCPKCGHSIDLFGSGGGRKTAVTTGVNFLGQIPVDPRLVSCSDAGSSYQESYPDSVVTRAFQNIAKRIILFTQMK
jgi:Mrp family chromosome partitioning ATPase